MVTEFETIPETMPLLDAVERLQRQKLSAGRVDVRCLVVKGESGAPTRMLTEADVIRAILPRWFREPKFANFVAKWLTKDLPEAALNEVWTDLARAARKKTVKDIVGDVPLVSMDPDVSLLKVAYLMHTERIKSIPVMQDGQIIGIVFRTSVFETISREIVQNAKR
jgi:CBS domain-containing protein